VKAVKVTIRESFPMAAKRATWGIRERLLAPTANKSRARVAVR